MDDGIADADDAPVVSNVDAVSVAVDCNDTKLFLLLTLKILEVVGANANADPTTNATPINPRNVIICICSQRYCELDYEDSELVVP